MSQRTLLLISIMAMVGIVAGLNMTPSGPPAPFVRDRICATVPTPGLDPTQASAAMLSIHAHSYNVAGFIDDQELVALPLMKLKDAAWVIRCGRGPRADSRRRRALAELLAYGAVGARFQDALEMLGVTDADLQVIRDDLDADHDVDDPSAEDPAELEFFLLAIVRDRLDRLVNAFQDDAEATCHWDATAPHQISMTDWTVGIRTFASVDADVSFAARSVDPQSWDECSELWSETHLVEWKSNPGEPKTIGAHPPGAHHPDPELLFEHFACECCECPNGADCGGSSCTSSSFQLLLCVRTICTPAPGGPGTCPSPEKFETRYRLPKGGPGECLSTGASFVPAFTWCGGTDPWWFCSGSTSTLATEPTVDEGWVTVDVDEETEETRVEAKKSLEFDEAGPNLALYRGLKKLEAVELSKELGELACCL
jgi:hypothetical protein